MNRWYYYISKCDDLKRLKDKVLSNDRILVGPPPKYHQHGRHIYPTPQQWSCHTGTYHDWGGTQREASIIHVLGHHLGRICLIFNNVFGRFLIQSKYVLKSLILFLDTWFFVTRKTLKNNETMLHNTEQFKDIFKTER